MVTWLINLAFIFYMYVCFIPLSYIIYFQFEFAHYDKDLISLELEQNAANL